ncbi:ATP-binding protein, partial [Moorena sp. SIO3H5]|uniref:ATP-binding protein n=1 Tax=Moorena sp. SIO3H5 TaxID=2607834 RepID=UPI0013B83C7E
SGVSRTVVYPNGEEKSIGRALVTADEAAHFQDFDPEGLYKNVAGMNPIRLRHAIKYAVQEQAGTEKVPVTRLYQAIRAFKAQTSVNFEVPDVTFANIGGYEQVKGELNKAIRLMTGSYDLPNEQLRRELIPRGFIFHGPPGTGKTLFAKAIANQLNATIQVVSGPEVTDMYVGESERKVRELFAEARRNAPAVLVFDEFDSIATKRSGRDDGGTRAGNAIVAQILTEMDGFRPDVPMLVIGTTNRLDIIDEALLRPSRFKAIAIGRPNLRARRAIAQVHAQHFNIELSSELLELIATETEGMSGDDIRSIFRDAYVGLHCEKPPRPVDAHRLGELVGLLRKVIPRP